MQLRELLWSRKRGFLLYLFGSLLTIASSITGHLVVALMVGQVTREEGLFTVFVVAGLLTLGSPMLQVISRFLRTAYMRDTLYDIRRLAFKKVLGQSYQRFASQSHSTYISRLVNDINLFEKDFFVSFLNVIVTSGIYIVVLGIIFFIDVPYALAAFAASLLLAVLSLYFGPRTITLEQEVSQANEEFSHVASNTLQGFEILRLNRVEEPFEKRFMERVQALERIKQNLRYFSDLQRAVFMSVGTIYTILSMIYVAWRMQRGEMDLTSAAFLIQASNLVVWELVMFFPFYNRVKAATEIYNKICLSDDTEQSFEGSQPFVFRREIMAEEVHFSYPAEAKGEEGREVFHNLSFTVKQGEKVLLKGVSGAGKSTLLQLLAKVYSPDTGLIRVDGVDLQEISDISLNRQIGYVYQNVFLFEDSIRQNIALYQDYPEERIQEAVDRAGLRSLVDSLPQGLDTPLAENGQNLSGGQRQRISIARALIKDTDLVFVDEATSGLDEEMGRSIESTLLSLPQTVLAISHRYYKGVSEGYDKVLKIQGRAAEMFTAEQYFELEGGSGE